MRGPQHPECFGSGGCAAVTHWASTWLPHIKIATIRSNNNPTVLIWSHVTNAGFSTSGQKPAGALPSDLPLQLRISWEQRVAQQHHKESHELSEGFVWDYRVVLTRPVAEVVYSLIPKQRPKLPKWPRILVRLYHCHLSPKYHKWGFKLSHLSDRDIFPVPPPFR